MSKFKSKYSPMKVVGIVFLIITLIIAVSLTNNTVRKFIFGSYASKSCNDLGSPSARNACNVEAEEAVRNSNAWYDSLTPAQQASQYYTRARNARIEKERTTTLFRRMLRLQERDN